MKNIETGDVVAHRTNGKTGTVLEVSGDYSARVIWDGGKRPSWVLQENIVPMVQTTTRRAEALRAGQVGEPPMRVEVRPGDEIRPGDEVFSVLRVDGVVHLVTRDGTWEFPYRERVGVER